MARRLFHAARALAIDQAVERLATRSVLFLAGLLIVAGLALCFATLRGSRR